MACFLSLEDAATVDRLHTLARDCAHFDKEDIEEVASRARELILRLATQAQGEKARRALIAGFCVAMADALVAELGQNTP